MGKGGDSSRVTEFEPKLDELAGAKPQAKGMQTDFIWVETDEPHASRRKQILAAHPEVRELFGPDENAVYKVSQFLCFVFFPTLGVVHLGSILWSFMCS